MKFQQKIILITVVISLLVGFLLRTMVGGAEGSTVFAFAAGAAVTGFFEIILGLFLLMSRDKRYSQAFLLSGGLIFLIGFVTCTSGLKL